MQGAAIAATRRRWFGGRAVRQVSSARTSTGPVRKRMGLPAALCVAGRSACTTPSAPSARKSRASAGRSRPAKAAMARLVPRGSATNSS
ncbi:hypothetical protein ACFQX7_16740 [Luedemannella flava]